MSVTGLLKKNSVRKMRTSLASYRARQVNLEKPYIGVTTDAVKSASDTVHADCINGDGRRW